MILIHKQPRDELAFIGVSAIGGATASSAFPISGDSHKYYVTNSHRNYVTIRLSHFLLVTI